MNNNLPPSNIEAEELILGGVLLDPMAIAKIIDSLAIEAFYVQAHRTIYQAMLSLHQQNQPTDLMFVSSYLQDHNLLTAIGGIVKLTQLLDRTVSAVNIDRFVKLVVEKWQRRKLISLCREIEAKAMDGTIAWDDLRQEADSKLTEAIADNSNAKGLKPISDFLPALWKELSEGKNPGTPTGLNYLDQCLGGGLRGGELIIVAARPSMGKTYVGQFLARIFAEQKPVAFFSMEMDAYSIVKRFWATEANIPQSALVSNAVSSEYAQALATSTAQLTNLKIHIDDTPGSQISPAYIDSQCNRLKRSHGDLGCVVVDYLQLIGDQGSNNRTGELGRYSSALKSLSKTFNCPVIALSQLNRGVEGRNDKRPVMSDIRSSGAIEQDADVVIMLYRDEYYNPNTNDQGILELIIPKNRLGKAGVTAKAEFDPSIGTIKNYISYAL